MRLEIRDGLLRIGDVSGQRWQTVGLPPPRFSFSYDTLVVDGTKAIRGTGNGAEALSAEQRAEVDGFLARLVPPPAVSPQRQLIADLRAFSHGLINSVLSQLEYDGLLDAMITGRADSGDLFAGEARRVLGYVDAVWNAFHGLEARIKATADADLLPLRAYADMMPFPPPMDFFSSGLYPGLFEARGADD